MKRVEEAKMLLALLSFCGSWVVPRMWLSFGRVFYLIFPVFFGFEILLFIASIYKAGKREKAELVFEKTGKGDRVKGKGRKNREQRSGYRGFLGLWYSRK